MQIKKVRQALFCGELTTTTTPTKQNTPIATRRHHAQAENIYPRHR